MKGIVFDIKEFALNDGPGIRTTVFMKGCPMRCKWCHNPEGLLMEPQLMLSAGHRRLSGKEYDSATLAELLMNNSDVYYESAGGVTFSGGEPLMQAGFVGEVIDRLVDVHVLLDTSGFAEEGVFKKLAEKVDHVYFDVKLIDAESHKKWTGVSNEPILHNLFALDELGVSYTLRVPLVPRVTDTPENLTKIAVLAQKLKNVSELHLLSYNSYAGSKYEAVGLKYEIEAEGEEEQVSTEQFFSGVIAPVRLF
ncbi:MAG: radical SAM protein [Phycisphaerae bacterium]